MVRSWLCSINTWRNGTAVGELSVGIEINAFFVEVIELHISESIDLFLNAGILLRLLHFSLFHYGIAVPRRSAEDDVQGARVDSWVHIAIRAVLSRLELR